MNDHADAAVQAPAPTPLRTMGIVGAIVLVVAGYEVIGISLRIPALYMGFLFATYWGAIRGLALAEWLPALLGGLTGITLAWLLHALPQAYGLTGLLVAIAITLVPIYLMIRRQAPLVVNGAFLIFLTVSTIPALATADDHLGMAFGMAYGAVYAGALALLLQRLAARRSAAAEAAPPATATAI